MIPMTPSASVAYCELESEESTYWPSVSPGVPLSTSGDEGAGGAKVRKPYTITKQRERWTEDEHQKFLEALKLYGRAWRRIEEHIGTKTAVQIRSHAQKFFSKIERDVVTQQGGGAETGVAQVIDIPPPRPKRKPSHPYPRKAGRSFGKISEDECALATAGSISSSSGISTMNIAEGCSKSNNVWEQDDAGEACHHEPASKDAPKTNHTDSAADAATRPWVMSKPANAGSSPATVAQIATSPPSSNQSPLPVAFPAAMPWARIFGGAMNPAMINPAMMSPQGMGMMMPWAAASGAPENGGAVSAIAATIAAASAWWAMQGGIPPTVIHPTMGAMYMGGAPSLAIPTPFLFSHCATQEVTVAAATVCGDAKEGGSGSITHVGDDGQDIPSSNGNTPYKSSALRRAERVQRVKELKARRMGSGNHLLSVSSDVCPSMSGGSGTNTLGQVTTAGNLSSGSAVSSLSKGVSLPANLSKVKQTFHDLVRKDREPAADVDGGGDDKRKRLRRASNDTTMINSENFPSITTTTTDQPVNPSLEKVGSISGSNNLSEQFTKILKDADRSPSGDEATPTDASHSCGSDGSEGAGDAQVDTNERRGPSSNSSACGNNVSGGGTDRSASSDGSSEGEATANVNRQRNSMENNDGSGRSSADPDVPGNTDRSSRQYTFSEFLPVRIEGEKPDGSGGGSSSRLLSRTASIDGEQRKEVTERGQMAFQALFKRDTLPRTFSPPPELLAFATEPEQISRPSSACNNITRSRSANAMEPLELPCSPRGRSRNQDSAFNTWQQLRGTCSASKLDRCVSGVSVPSSEPMKVLEELQSSEQRRNTRKGRTHSHANNWLQLAPTSSRGKDDEDVSADSGADDPACQKQQQQQQQKESFVCKLDLSIANDRNDGSDTGGPVVTSLDLSPRPTSQSLSLSIASCLKQQQPHNNSSSVSNRTVKYSGLGFVPYQRATPSHVETTPEEKN